MSGIKLAEVLCGILFNLNKREKVKIKPDDASPEIEIEVTPVGVLSEDDALVCVIPYEKVLKYSQVPYDIKIQAQDGHLILSIEKQHNKSSLFTAHGEKIVNDSPVIQRLLSKLSGGEIGGNKIQNP